MKTMPEPLTADQTLVLQYLKNQPDKFISEADISQQADGQERYWEDPRWSNHALAQLQEMKLVEPGENGGFRAMAGPDAKRPALKAGEPRKRFIAPQLEAILQKHGFCYCLNYLEQQDQNLQPQV
jgi:hypothetical protein